MWTLYCLYFLHLSLASRSYKHKTVIASFCLDMSFNLQLQTLENLTEILKDEIIYSLQIFSF